MNDFVDGTLKDKDTWMPDVQQEASAQPVKCKLVCGADVLETFNVPGLWNDEDVSGKALSILLIRKPIHSVGGKNN